MIRRKVKMSSTNNVVEILKGSNIELTPLTKGNEVLWMSGIPSTMTEDELKQYVEENLSFKKSKDNVRDLVITDNRYRTVVTVKNYFSKDGKSNSTALTTLRVGSRKHTIDLTLSNYIDYTESLAANSKNIVNGSSFNDVLLGTDEANTIYSVAGNDYINAQKGNDKIYTGNGNETIVFNSADGEDIVYSASKGDSIVFQDWDSSDELTYQKDGSNLKLIRKSVYKVDEKIYSYIEDDNTIYTTEPVRTIFANNIKGIYLTDGILTSYEIPSEVVSSNVSLYVNNGVYSFTKSKGYKEVTESDNVTYKDANGFIQTAKRGNLSQLYLTNGKLSYNSVTSLCLNNETLYIDGNSYSVTSGTAVSDFKKILVYNKQVEGDVYLKIDGSEEKYSADEIQKILSGSDVPFSYTTDRSEAVSVYDTVILSGYFNVDKDKALDLIYKGESLDQDNIVVQVNGSGTIAGTYFDDEIKGGDNADTVSTGESSNLKGDIVYTGLKNDVINITGSGTKSIIIFDVDGNDTINTAEVADKVYLYFEDKDSLIFSKSKNDAIITRANNSKTTIKNYFTSKNAPNIFIKNIADMNNSNADSINLLDEFNSNASITKFTTGSTQTGSVLNDTFIGTTATNKIYTGSGEDKITPAAGKDTINITGNGIKHIAIKNDDGDDTISGVELADKVILYYEENARLTCTRDGNNAVITRTYGADNKTAKTILTNFYKDTTVNNIVIKNLNGTIDESIDNPDVTDLRLNSDFKALSGNETFYGGAGNNTYVLSNDFGQDSIVTAGKSNHIVLDNVNIETTRNGNDLVLNTSYSSAQKYIYEKNGVYSLKKTKGAKEIILKGSYFQSENGDVLVYTPDEIAETSVGAAVLLEHNIRKFKPNTLYITSDGKLTTTETSTVVDGIVYLKNNVYSLKKTSKSTAIDFTGKYYELANDGVGVTFYTSEDVAEIYSKDEDFQQVLSGQGINKIEADSFYLTKDGKLTTVADEETISIGLVNTNTVNLKNYMNNASDVTYQITNSGEVKHLLDGLVLKYGDEDSTKALTLKGFTGSTPIENLAEQFISGRKDDSLYGGVGNNEYVMSGDFGKDKVYISGANQNKLVFDDGVNVVMERSDNDLLINAISYNKPDEIYLKDNEYSLTKVRGAQAVSLKDAYFRPQVLDIYTSNDIVSTYEAREFIDSEKSNLEKYNLVKYSPNSLYVTNGKLTSVKASNSEDIIDDKVYLKDDVYYTTNVEGAKTIDLSNTYYHNELYDLYSSAQISDMKILDKALEQCGYKEASSGLYVDYYGSLTTVAGDSESKNITAHHTKVPTDTLYKKDGMYYVTAPAGASAKEEDKISLVDSYYKADSNGVVTSFLSHSDWFDQGISRESLIADGYTLYTSGSLFIRTDGKFVTGNGGNIISESQQFLYLKSDGTYTTDSSLGTAKTLRDFANGNNACYKLNNDGILIDIRTVEDGELYDKSALLANGYIEYMSESSPEKLYINSAGTLITRKALNVSAETEVYSLGSGKYSNKVESLSINGAYYKTDEDTGEVKFYTSNDILSGIDVEVMNASGFYKISNYKLYLTGSGDITNINGEDCTLLRDKVYLLVDEYGNYKYSAYKPAVNFSDDLPIEINLTGGYFKYGIKDISNENKDYIVYDKVKVYTEQDILLSIGKDALKSSGILPINILYLTTDHKLSTTYTNESVEINSSNIIYKKDGLYYTDSVEGAEEINLQNGYYRSADANIYLREDILKDNGYIKIEQDNLYITDNGKLSSVRTDYSVPVEGKIYLKNGVYSIYNTDGAMEIDLNGAYYYIDLDNNNEIYVYTEDEIENVVLEDETLIQKLTNHGYFKVDGNNLFIASDGSLISDSNTPGAIRVAVEDKNTAVIKNYLNSNGASPLTYENNGQETDVSKNIVINYGNVSTSKSQTLRGYQANSVFDIKEVFNGGVGNDIIYTGSGGGEDVITPGKGDDKVYITDSGEKTINIAKVDGSDTIFGAANASRTNIVFTNGIEDLILSKDPANNDLKIQRSYQHVKSVENELVTDTVYYELDANTEPVLDLDGNLIYTLKSETVYANKLLSSLYLTADGQITLDETDNTLIGNNKLYQSLEQSDRFTMVEGKEGFSPTPVAEAYYDISVNELSFDANKVVKNGVVKAPLYYEDNNGVKTYTLNSHSVCFSTSSASLTTVKDFFDDNEANVSLNSLDTNFRDFDSYMNSVEDATIFISGNNKKSDVIYGTRFKDTITDRKDMKSVFLNPKDNDIIYAGAGDDIIKIAGGNDRVYGEEGNDEYHIDRVSLLDNTTYIIDSQGNNSIEIERYAADKKYISANDLAIFFDVVIDRIDESKTYNKYLEDIFVIADRSIGTNFITMKDAKDGYKTPVINSGIIISGDYDYEGDTYTEKSLGTFSYHRFVGLTKEGEKIREEELHQCYNITAHYYTSKTAEFDGDKYSIVYDNVYALDVDYVNAVRDKVADFLSKTDYDSSLGLLAAGSAGEIQGLYECYNQPLKSPVEFSDDNVLQPTTNCWQLVSTSASIV